VIAQLTTKATRLRRDTHVRESAISTAWGLGAYALGFLTGPLLARALGPAGRGEVAAVIAVSQLLPFLLAFGVPAAVAFLAGRYPDRDLLGTALATTAAVALPFLVAAWFAAPHYLPTDDPGTIFWARAVLVTVLPVIGQTVLLERVRTHSAGLRFNVLRSLPLLLNAAAVVGLFVTNRLTVSSALAALAVTLLCSALIVAVLTWPRTSLRVDPVVARATWAYGIRRYPSTLANSVLVRYDQVLLAMLASSVALGYYAVAASVSGLIMPVGHGIAYALQPQLRRSNEPPRAVLRRSVRLVLLSSSLLALALMVVSPVLVPLVYGGDFSRSVLPLIVLLPGQVAGAASGVFGNHLASMGFPGRASLPMVVGAGLTIVTLPFAVSAWGIMGAAAVTTAVYVLVALYGRHLCHQIRHYDNPLVRLEA
jgi:O-antigen/teichoic acid export membrane protein